jgi:ABC-type lipoprotein release transport system permease subunit
VLKEVVINTTRNINSTYRSAKKLPISSILEKILPVNLLTIVSSLKSALYPLYFISTTKIRL